MLLQFREYCRSEHGRELQTLRRVAIYCLAFVKRQWMFSMFRVEKLVESCLRRCIRFIEGPIAGLPCEIDRNQDAFLVASQ